MASTQTGDPAAAHNRLLASTSDSPLTAAAVAEAQRKKALGEARRKFCGALDQHLFDYRHNHPNTIVNCATTLIKIFTNVVKTPEEEKFRKVKASSNVFQNNIQIIRGGEELMNLAGWYPKVVDMQKYWVFEWPVDSVRFGVLEECLDVLEKNLKTMQDKADRAAQEREAKLGHDKKERERVRLALQDDALERKIRNEVTQVVGPVKASPLPSEMSPTQRGGAAGRHGPEPPGALHGGGRHAQGHVLGQDDGGDDDDNGDDGDEDMAGGEDGGRTSPGTKKQQ